MPGSRAERREPTRTLRWRGGWARLGLWRGDPQIAHLALAATRPPDVRIVERWLGSLREQGFAAVVTNALTTTDALPFLDLGFEIREQLHLLAHDLDRLQPPSRPTRRARRTENEAVLALDHAAFEPAWQFDETSLEEARRATPACRSRIAAPPDVDVGAPLIGYAITGRDRRLGYLQRLAVDPAHRGQGWASSLVWDSLHWLHRYRAAKAYVNTQLGNEPALALYRSCGFYEVAPGLRVLGRSL
jgi:ribosomal protein S18 acetylase RimI-like enzyme